MELLLQAFVLGNGAIPTNVCLLPLYPGLLAFLAAQRSGDAGDATDRVAAARRRRIAGSLGLFVLAGVLTLMLALGALLAGTRTAVAGLLLWLRSSTSWSPRSAWRSWRAAIRSHGSRPVAPSPCATRGRQPSATVSCWRR